MSDAERSRQLGGRMDESADVERRRFIQGAGMAGLVGAAGLFGAVGTPRALAQQGGESRAAETGPGGAEFPKPDGLKALGQLDARFPVSYETSVPESMRVVTEHFRALSGRDPEALARTLHFPFGLYEGTEPIVVESEANLLADSPHSINVTGRGDTEVMAGSYDLLERLELQTFSPVGAAISMSFMRYTPDGRKLALCDGIYAVTNNDGKWAIQLASTIFTPAEHIGETYDDAIEAHLRRGRNWMLGYSLRDQSILNGTRIPGRSARVAIYGPRERAGNARAGRPMAGYRVKGIKSRLSVSEATQESIDASDAEFPCFADWAGGGVGQWAYTLNLPEARVLHATVNKAHTMGGYIRYTADHTVISETRSLGILVYRNGRWGPSGGIGNMMLHHDRTNSIG